MLLLLSIIGQLLLLGIAGGMIVTTVTRSVVFLPLRTWADRRGEMIGELFRCPYCFSHWVGFLLTFLAGFWPVSSIHPVVSWFLSSLVVAWLSILAGTVAYNAVLKMPLGERDRERLEQMQSRTKEE